MRVAGAFFALIAVAAVSEASAGARIDREIARLESALGTVKSEDLPEEVRPGIEAYRAALDRARRATVPEYRLYLLRDPFVGIETLAFLAKETESRGSVDRFRQLWESRRSRFETKAPPARGTLLQRGLAESATTRAERLFRASLPYAKAAQPWSGVYYLGEAEGNLRFRELVLALSPDGAAEKTPSRARVAAMLEELERATLTFFATDVTNRNVIAVSVRLKEARELLDASRIAGATFLAVEARAALSRRGGPRGSYPPGASAPAGSIRSFIQAWADAEESPMKEALREEVAPFFGALFVPARQRFAASQPRVTVTLVRWPYT